LAAALGLGTRHEHEIDRYSSEEVLVGARGRAEDPFEGAGEIPAIRSRLAALKRDERRALSLLAAGYSYREIGQLTDWAYTKVNRYIAEGRAALRGWRLEIPLGRVLLAQSPATRRLIGALDSGAMPMGGWWNGRGALGRINST
jgi:DNA-directed RNA polymerase specialized sigma24 family protein